MDVPILLFDTNFFRKFVENPDFFKSANGLLSQRYKGISPSGMSLFVSPIAFLEYLGITVSPPPIPDGLIKDSKPTFESMMALAERTYEHAHSFFSTQANITNQRIEAELAKRKTYVCAEGMKYWEIAVSRYSNPANLPIIYHCLSVEFLQKLPMKKDKASYYHPSLWLDAAKRISEGMDVCLFRTIQWRWNVEPRSHGIKKFGREIVNRLARAMGVRTHDDFLDAELVHYSCFGKVDGKTLRAVDAFTCDPVEKVKDRIRVFTEGLRKTVEELNNTVDSTGKDWIYKFPAEFSVGTVTFFDELGNVLEGPLVTSQLVAGN